MPKVETFNKEAVIKQATEVFHRKSYSLTSMQDLVDATGLNRSSIYNSFGSKLDLYMVCLKDYQASFKCTVEKVLSNVNSPIQAIEAIFNLVNKYEKAGKQIKLKHLSEDAKELLYKSSPKFREVIIEAIDDPRYHLAENPETFTKGLSEYTF